jgi:DNA-binding transcriptional LysR family regulator
MVIPHVAYFLAAAAEQNITRAAKLCGVTQPTLSLAIKQLETDLGVKLFERTTRGTVLTPAGRAIRPHFMSVSRSLKKAKLVARHLEAATPSAMCAGAAQILASAGGETAGLF